jgi:hypothetical protein
MNHRVVALAGLLLIVVLGAEARATWLDPAWKFRRQIDVSWDADAARGTELALAEFYTGGKCKPDGSDVRVATDEGRLVASRVLFSGQGDKISVLFALTRHVSRYFVYFGNDKPEPVKGELAELKIQAGLLLEMKRLPPHVNASRVEELKEAFDKCPDTIGQTIIPAPALGINPFNAEDRTISRITGSLTTASAEGDFGFAMAVHSRAALYIDGKMVLGAADGPSDARYHADVHLSPGRHDWVLYHANFGGDGRFVVAWILPMTSKYVLISSSYFGTVSNGVCGALEEIKKDWVADFAVQYVAECFFADHYSHRYKFFAAGPLKNPKLAIKWDFGDGQTSTASQPEHVYLADGIYNVTVTLQLGPTSGSITNHLHVSRDFPHIDNPPSDQPARQSAVVQGYDLTRVPDEWLPWIVLLHQRAEKPDLMFAAATRLASLSHHPAVGPALEALEEATQAAEKVGRSADMASVLEKASPSSDLQPNAAEDLARLLLWRVGDFPRAVRALSPFSGSNDADLKTLYAQALVLAQKADEGRKILVGLPVTGDPSRRAALSGAQARTIEFYIKQRDAEAGEKAWMKWQKLYPADFLEGYSVVLQTRLMELQNVPAAAAKVAEAFANAVPTSSYAPQLLDRASKLLAKSDAGHSAELRKMLKERYPEDPLSQE